MMKFLSSVLTGSLLMFTCSCSTAGYIANQELPHPEPRDNYGILEEHYYRSESKGPQFRRMFVYLPHDYYISTRHYPTLYLLHGARGNEMSWITKGRALEIIDSLNLCGSMPETIVIVPNMNQYDNERDYGMSRLKRSSESYLDLDGCVEASFMDDVVRYVDSHLRTIPDKRHRALAGLSIGAMQTIHISATHPRIFGYIGAFSPIIEPFFGMRGKESIYYSLKLKHIIQFADPSLQYSIMIGKSDFNFRNVMRFCRYLDSRVYDYDLFVSPGGHEWANWRMYLTKFAQAIFTMNDD